MRCTIERTTIAALLLLGSLSVFAKDTLKRYALADAPTVREEMYSLIESRIASQSLSGQTELAPALNAALHADHLNVSSGEKARIFALLESINGSGTSFRESPPYGVRFPKQAELRSQKSDQTRRRNAALCIR